MTDRMKWICKLFGHRPGPEVWNEGLYFSTCESCRAELIRPRDGVWYSVPRGFRVARRPEGHHEVHWSKVVSRAHQAPQRSRRGKPPVT